MANEHYYTYPTGVFYKSDNIADLYLDFPDFDSFLDYYGPINETTIDNIKNKYNIDSSVNVNFYVGGRKAPLNGISVFQKLINSPSIGSGDSALDAASAAASAGLVNGFNALVSGESDIYSIVSTIVAGGAGYELAGLLSVGVEAAVCAIVALLGYKVGTNVYEELDSHQWFQNLLDLGADWIASDDSKLARAYRQVLGVQYSGKTYLDSRFYEAVKDYLKQIVPDYTNLIIGSDIEEVDSVISPTLPILVYGGDPYAQSNFYFNYVQGGVFYTYASIAPTSAKFCVVKDIYTFPNSDVLTTESIIVASDTITAFRYATAYSQGNPIQPPEPNTWGATTTTFVYDGKTVYYYVITPEYLATPNIPVTDNYPYPSINTSNAIPSDAQIAWTLIYGQSTEPIWPDGLEPAPWHYPVDPTSNPLDVVIDIDETTVPFYPVSLPNGPYVYPTYPDDYTDITIIENPDEQILPYHIPPEVLPETNPESDPDDNPSNPAPVIIPIVLPIGGSGSSGGQSPSIPIPTVFPPFFDGVSQYGGIYTVYAPTQQQLYDFGDWLWVKWTDASLTKIINNPFDGVISLHEIYATPGITGAKEITSGFLKSNVTAATVGDRYTEIDCGTVIVPENYQNYLDYSPYSKVYCFLPFIGLVQLNSDDIVGHAVNITYKVDSYSGACVAIITVAQSNGDDENYSVAMYQFEGNCAVQLPISGGSQASLTAGLWLAGSSAVGSIVNGVASTVSGNGVMDLLHGVSNAISDVSATLLTRKSDVQHSGNMSGNFGAMAGKKPYLIVKFPRQVPAPNYNMDYGYPAHRRVTIGQCTGYLRVREVNIISATATDDEKAKIEQLLKEGVYFE